YGQREVTPAPLRGGLVHLEGVFEIEELQGTCAVVDEAVERRQKGCSPGEVRLCGSELECCRVDAPRTGHPFAGRFDAGVFDVGGLERVLGCASAGDAESREATFIADAQRLVE